MTDEAPTAAEVEALIARMKSEQRFIDGMIPDSNRLAEQAAAALAAQAAENERLSIGWRTCTADLAKAEAALRQAREFMRPVDLAALDAASAAAPGEKP